MKKLWKIKISYYFPSVLVASKSTYKTIREDLARAPFRYFMISLRSTESGKVFEAILDSSFSLFTILKIAGKIKKILFFFYNQI